MRLRWASVITLSGCLGCVAEVLPPESSATGSGTTTGKHATSASTGTTASATSTSTSTGTSGTSTNTSTASSTTSSGTTTSTSTSASTTSTGSGTTTSTTTGSSTTTGTTGATCSPACGDNAHCEASLCVCEPGFTPGTSGCEPTPAGDPSTHSQADVCQQWTQGHVENAAQPFTPGTAQCDPGTMSPDAMDDALRRLNMFRWMIGLGPVTDDPSNDTYDQACAIVSADNAAGPSAHFPDPSEVCYSSAGAQGAGSSNIAWGCGSAADAMDQWVQDWGNETTLGHRRWIFNPPLDGVGIGFYSGGSGQYGSASCLGVFGGGNPNPDPTWTAYPPPGFVPIDSIYPVWSLHSDTWGIDQVQVTITQLSDGSNIPVTMQQLSGGYGTGAISWTLQGGVEAGDTYRIAVSGVTNVPDFTYDVKPVSCN
ncbi:MAG: CAP domain-containing protein [Deltaproteobacteria bacterium]|nr:CAP domain-containing protein [Deltaproteobacteria bacterium]